MTADAQQHTTLMLFLPRVQAGACARLAAPRMEARPSRHHRRPYLLACPDPPQHLRPLVSAECFRLRVEFLLPCHLELSS